MATEPFSIKYIKSSQSNNTYSNCYHFLLILGASFQFNVSGVWTVVVEGIRGERIGRRSSFGGVGAMSVQGGGGYTLVAYIIIFYFATGVIVNRVLNKILRYKSIIVTVPGGWWSPYVGGRGRRPIFRRGRCEERAGVTCVIL